MTFLTNYPICQGMFSGNSGLLAALFLGGLGGSVMHCTGMCGPFVLAQVSGFSLPEGKNHSWWRLLLLPYHAGRLTTYTAMGVTAAWLTMRALFSPSLQIFSHLILAVAAAAFLLSAFSPILKLPPVCGTPSWLMQRVAPLFHNATLRNGYLLGVMLGFLPCGLVFAALMAVAATADPLKAFGGMIAFGLGTMPALVAVGFGGRFLFRFRPAWVKPAFTIMMVVNSLLLFALAGKGLV